MVPVRVGMPVKDTGKIADEGKWIYQGNSKAEPGTTREIQTPQGLMQGLSCPGVSSGDRTGQGYWTKILPKICCMVAGPYCAASIKTGAGFL